MSSILNNILHNDLAIIFIGVSVLTAIPTGLTYWYKAKRAAMDADLKMRMLELGMSAGDIERVLTAESDPDHAIRARARCNDNA
ncbi:MAG: hypothetical protein ABL921_27570 [Pirellula sp.]